MEIIAQNEGTINSSNQKSFSIDPVGSNSQNTKRIHPSRLQRQILMFYYDLHLKGIPSSNYSLDELSLRFERTKNHISSQLKELEDYGCMASLHKGQNYKERWITYEGICLLEGKHLNQILNQDEDVPYIYLPDQRIDQLKITKETQNCGQLSPEQQLDSYLDRENTPYTLKKRIKKSISSTPIGPERRRNVIQRILNKAKTSKIYNKLAYIRTALQKELEDMHDFIRYMTQKQPKTLINEYDLPDLDDIGCIPC